MVYLLGLAQLRLQTLNGSDDSRSEEHSAFQVVRLPVLDLEWGLATSS